MNEKMNCERNEATSRGANEVTPEMVEAGWEVLRQSGLMEPDSELGKLWVADIYLAMLSVSPASDSSARRRPEA